MTTPQEILKQYWNFETFRDKQLEIISTVLDQKDCLALLPTGGGKSICYQVPGILSEGVCLVISPLIALMEDQIAQLKKRGIKATAITSAMSKRQIDIALDNAIYGNTKFLYVSPERLKTHLFKVRFEKMNINLVAVDEAHCISEWGYDFRPSYLEIAELRKLKPNVPFLALTATATPDVIDDIQEKLEFREKRLIRKSFERPNLTYNASQTNNKLNRIEAFLKSNSGSGIIYCSTRRKVKELYLKLNEKGYSVDYYHAGLNFEERRTKQTAWTNNKTQIIIATNAFGMGIDKPDVRFVLHHDIPQSLEAYFQEAGRGGRDEKPAIAHLYFQTEDINDLKEKVELRFPPIDTIKRIYNALGNHFQLAIGSGKEETFPLDLAEFADKYDQHLILVFNALKFLELCGFIRMSENYKQPGKLRFLADNQTLYNFQVRDPELNKIILFLLRTEMGIFDDHVKINEYKIAAKTGMNVRKIKEKLQYLSQTEAADYVPRSDLPTITYTTERLADNNLSISPKFHKNRKDIAWAKLEAVIHFLTADTCKNEILLNYFGETDTTPCGRCNTCRSESEMDPAQIKKEILDCTAKLSNHSSEVTILNLISELGNVPEDLVLENLRWLADNGKITIDPLGKKISLKS